MDTNTGLMILSGALAVVTAYYALTVRRMAAAVQDMVAATKEMVETASRTQTLSLAPQVECRTLNSAEPGRRVGRRGSRPVDLADDNHQRRIPPRAPVPCPPRNRLRRASRIRRFVTHWLEPGGRESSESRSAGRIGRKSSSTWRTWRARATWSSRSPHPPRPPSAVAPRAGRLVGSHLAPSHAARVAPVETGATTRNVSTQDVTP